MLYKHRGIIKLYTEPTNKQFLLCFNVDTMLHNLLCFKLIIYPAKNARKCHPNLVGLEAKREVQITIFGY